MKTLFAVLVFALLVTTGCNTMEGLGKDIQKAGGAIEGAAKKK